MAVPPLSTKIQTHQIFIRNYIYDIFTVETLCFDSEQKYKPFLGLLTSRHKNLRFTVEVGQNTSPFLDAEIKLNDFDVDSWVFRKKINTHVLLNFNTIALIKWKSSI